ncbi:MAG: hypothetical protein HN392_00500 [Anaerolineae bacterium]|nr:hypothetical protein [Anaerolineae bacterium]MBT7191935.1 hypothetical protein [Anaerolineae bacterium]MBT7988594.1 hypothetical protein [Anaerolineae bacterium]
MPSKLHDALDMDLYPDAKDTAIRIVDEFATSLVLEAKSLAYQEKADVILSSHIEDANELIRTKRKDAISKQVSQIIGGAFFGAFIQGFVTELSNGNALLIGIYVALGFVGVGLFTWGLWK